MGEVELDHVIDEVRNRGPSYQGQYSTDGITFYSSVLSLRQPFTRQPVVQDGRVLAFNGELYNSGIDNDTDYFMHMVKEKGVLETLQEVRGEYAFVYYDQESIWFARDFIGRRSLLYREPSEDQQLVISSVVPSAELDEYKEVPGGAVMRYNVQNKTLEQMNWTYQGSEYGLKLPYSPISRVTESLSGIEDKIAELEALFRQAVDRRVNNIYFDPGPGPQGNAGADVASNGNGSNSFESEIAIMFSGGIDCTLLAAMVDNVLDKGRTVDLLNVAFENKRTGGGYSTPDRQLGWQSFKELNSRSSAGRFRFVEINVPFEETMAHRPRVEALMFPKDSVMDLSIALAFYFVSRGQGKLYDSPDNCINSDYSPKAHVLLSGLGADELFGGYTRHSTKLAQAGYPGLAEELDLDFGRLHERNLGRDDRVSACWGREVRYPFLDEQFVAWALQCPLNYKVLDDQGKLGTKYILRQLAQQQGLELVSKELKRAIQFGARSAKMEIGQGKIKGHEKLKN